MLTLDRCRKLLDEGVSPSDEELDALRGQLYSLAKVFADVWITKSPKLSNAVDEIEERAAIIEFEGKRTRRDAEKQALQITLKKVQ